MNFIQLDNQIVDDLIDSVKKENQIRLEPLAEYLDSMTMHKLSDISKLVNKVIKNVKIENYVDVLEVALNPFMKL